VAASGGCWLGGFGRGVGGLGPIYSTMGLGLGEILRVDGVGIVKIWLNFSGIAQFPL
jgi:hypothetical protein